MTKPYITEDGLKILSALKEGKSVKTDKGIFCIALETTLVNGCSVDEEEGIRGVTEKDGKKIVDYGWGAHFLGHEGAFEIIDKPVSFEGATLRDFADEE